MTTVMPGRPKIYHITHMGNLAKIVHDGCLLSDAAMIARGGPQHAIGMSSIKQRRVEELEVSCRPGTKVGDYVPFYFCSRSVMLYVIHRANHDELTYRDGQEPIVHLVADLNAVITWAESADVGWAFSLSNAGAYYTEFRSRRQDLDQLDWGAIANTDFRSREVKEAKQAEFLVHGSLPFRLIERIGVKTRAVATSIGTAIAGSPHKPTVEVCPGWYF